MSGTILIVDDERNIRRTLRMVLEGAGYEVFDAESAEAGLETLEAQEIDLTILDVRMPGMGGVALLEHMRKTDLYADIPVLMISGHASVTEAVAACQAGANDFFEKPLARDRVLVSVANALKTSKLQREVVNYRKRASTRYEMIGESAVMKALYDSLEKVAPTTGRVLITGESGTGKELIARAIHRLSPRAEASFIKVNCAAIPAELIESELFGYEQGAFTGASSRRKGMFELADRGTLFLDEIGDMSLNAQAKVLRALQSGEISRVGGEKVVSVDVRVLAATNRDLEKAVAEGEFREDLYFRLNVIPIESPALRERCSDIPLLTNRFVRDFCDENGMRPKAIDPEVLEALSARTWPGNVRELRNVVERMVILSGSEITLDDLPSTGRLEAQTIQASARPPLSETDETGRPLTLREYRELAEREFIIARLRDTEWNVSKAAVKLGVERTNLHKKIRAYGIERSDS